MEQLSFKTLKTLGYKGYLKPEAPEKALQFGEGNFLRAFVGTANASRTENRCLQCPGRFVHAVSAGQPERGKGR